MHICFLTHEYPKKGHTQGGIGSVVQTIGRALIQKNISVSVVGIGNYETEIEEDNGVKVYRIKSSNLKIGKFYQNKNKLLSKLSEINKIEPIDIVEGSELNFAFFPKKYFAKKVIRLHGGHRFFAESMGRKPALWRSYQESKSFNNADALVSVSNYVGNKTKELVRFKQKFQTIYNLVDTTKFYQADKSKIIPRKLVFVGTVTEKKGIRQLVQAMPEVVAKYPDCTLVIIGRDWIDPKNGKSYVEYLKTFITKDIQKNIHIIGPLPHDEIPTNLESAEICCYPSHMEAQGLVVVEAMAMAKPIIFSEKGPGPEMINHTKNGLLCDPFNSHDIAENILYMFENSQEAMNMGRNARKYVLDRFNPENIIQQNINFYRSLI